MSLPIVLSPKAGPLEPFLSQVCFKSKINFVYWPIFLILAWILKTFKRKLTDRYFLRKNQIPFEKPTLILESRSWRHSATNFPKQTVFVWESSVDKITLWALKHCKWLPWKYFIFLVFLQRNNVFLAQFTKISKRFEYTQLDDIENLNNFDGKKLK